MSAKTKIVVFHMKELVYTVIFVVLGILFLLLMITMFLPKDDETASPEPSQSVASNEAVGIYTPGIYTTELVLGNTTVDVEVIVNQEAISSIRLANVSPEVTTMYPLLSPTLDKICDQVYETQSLDNITYSSENKYTSLVLLEAIRNSISKAQIGTTD